MDFRAVRYFEQIAMTGSLRAAAERLRVASSALSRTIALLESELGVELFNRSRSGMTLTTAGEIYLRYARGVTLDLERLHAEIDALRGLRRGHIRLAAVQGVIDLVMETIADFRQRFPGVTFELRAGGAGLVSQAVADGDVEIGIGAGDTDDGGLEVVYHAMTPLLALARPDFAWPEGRPPRSLADIGGRVAIAIPDDTFSIRRQLEDCAAGHGLRLAPALVTGSVDALSAFARLGCGVTFLPPLAVREDLASGALAGTALNDPILNQASITIVTAHGRNLSPASREFLTGLTRTCSQKVEL